MDEFVLDLSFLDDDDSIDKFVEDLTTINILVFKNDDPDMSICWIKDGAELNTLTNSIFKDSSSTIQMIVPNPHPSMDRCPYFRIIMDKYTTKSSINYKFEAFLKMANITNVSTRCFSAMVIGLMPEPSMHLGVPSCFCMTNIERISFIGDLDMTCMQSAVAKSHKGCRNLMDIPGISIHECLIDDVHWSILKYLQHPAATCIQRYFDEITRYWTLHFNLIARYEHL